MTQSMMTSRACVLRADQMQEFQVHAVGDVRPTLYCFGESDEVKVRVDQIGEKKAGCYTVNGTLLTTSNDIEMVEIPANTLLTVENTTTGVAVVQPTPVVPYSQVYRPPRGTAVGARPAARPAVRRARPARAANRPPPIRRAAARTTRTVTRPKRPTARSSLRR